MKRIISVILAVLSVVLMFASCRKETDTAIYYPVTENFGSLDPQIASGIAAKNIVFNCFEGLVRVDENGDIKPAGASSWEVSADLKVYTFHLRQDAKWYFTNTSKEELSDKDPGKTRIPADFDERVTAKDYVFGLQRAVDPATGSADGKYLAAIKNAAAVIEGKRAAVDLGVRAVDDFTLQITLDYDDPDILYYLTRPVAMPCNQAFFEACRGRYGLAMEYMLCNGVYMVYRWTADSLVRLEKNIRYSGAEKAKNDRVWVYYVEDADSVPDKIAGGNYDAGYVDGISGVEKFGNEKKYALQPCSDVLWGYWFNCNSTAFASTDMRLAFASSCDRSILSKPDYIEGTADRLLTRAIAPYFDYTPGLIEYDEKKANEYYKSALEKDKELDSSMTITVLTSEDFADTVIKQVQIWQRVFGMNVKIQTEKRATAERLLQNGSYEVAFLPVKFTAFNTSEFFKSFSSDSSYNISGYKNTNYDKLINSITYTMTDAQKDEVYKKCEQTLLSYATVIPVYTEASYFVQAKDVSGIYSVSREEVYFRNAVKN